MSDGPNQEMVNARTGEPLNDLLRDRGIARWRQFEPAVNGVFWRSTSFFVLVLRQQDFVL